MALVAKCLLAFIIFLTHSGQFSFKKIMAVKSCSLPFGRKIANPPKAVVGCPLPAFKRNKECQRYLLQ
jgi:hypothetical protein